MPNIVLSFTWYYHLQNHSQKDTQGADDVVLQPLHAFTPNTTHGKLILMAYITLLMTHESINYILDITLMNYQVVLMNKSLCMITAQQCPTY